MKLLLLLLLAACASAPLTEEEQYERLAKRESMRDKIRAQRQACHDALGMVEVYRGDASSIERRKMQRNLNYLPRHARPYDFACGRTEDVLRNLGY